MATFQGPPPTGYRFRPKDDELLTFYLTNKINAHYPLPSLYPHIFDFDVYAYHPSTIFKSSESHRYGGDNDNSDNDGDGEMHCYIFTNLKTKESNDNYNVCIKGNKKGSSSGKRKCRTVGNWGTWEQQFTKNVTNFKGSLIGFKKYFKFVPSNNNKKDGKYEYEYEYEWSMYEYTLLDHPDFALCRLIKKKMNKKNNNGSGIIIQLAHVDNDDDDGDNRKRARVEEWCWDNSALIGSPCLTNVVDYDCLSGIDEFINDVDKGIYDELFISKPGKQDYNNNDDDDEHGITNSKLARVDESLDDGVDKEVYDELLSQLGQVQYYNNHHLTLVNDNDSHLQISSSLPDQCFSVDDSTKADQDWDDIELEDLLNQD